MDLVQRKSQFVELTRFIGALIIVCHHSYTLGNRELFIGGWAFVEYFFFLTGYFTALHFSDISRFKDECEKLAFMYMKNKVIRIFPYAMVGIVLGIIYKLTQHLSFDDKLKTLFSVPFNFLLLKGSTFSNETFGFNDPLVKAGL